MSNLLVNQLTVNQLTASNRTTKRIGINTGDTLYVPGSVVQVAQTLISTPTSMSVPANRAHTDIPSLFCTITPKSVLSKIYITARWFGEFAPQNANYNTMFGLKRNGASVFDPTTLGGAGGLSMASTSYWADDGASTPEMAMFDYMDSPNTVALVTYQVYVSAVTASTLYTNRTVQTSNEFGSSSITLWEIAQ